MLSAKPVLGHPRRDLRTRMHSQLAPDVLEVRLRRPRRDRQPHSNGMVGQPLGDQPGYLKLTVSERHSRARRLAEEAEHGAQRPSPVPVIKETAGTCRCNPIE